MQSCVGFGGRSITVPLAALNRPENAKLDAPSTNLLPQPHAPATHLSNNKFRTVIWDLCSKKDVLWVRWVHAYYLKSTDFQNYTQIDKQWHSWNWKVLVKCKEKILPQLSQCIDSKGRFLIRRAYDFFKGVTHKTGFFQLIWKSNLPPRHAFFVWMLLKGRLSTISRLQSKGMLQNQCNSCCFCGDRGENVQHLFLTCQVAKKLQQEFSISFGVNFRDFKRRLWYYARARKGEFLKLAVGLCYHLWLERNRRIFQCKKLSVEAIKLRILADAE